MSFAIVIRFAPEHLAVAYDFGNCGVCSRLVPSDAVRKGILDAATIMQHKAGIDREFNKLKNTRMAKSPRQIAIEKKFLDPACGSGGMFVQAARYMHRHNARSGKAMDFRYYGVEKVKDDKRFNTYGVPCSCDT